MKQHLSILVFIAIVVCSCADVGTPPPIVEPSGEDRFLIDPRIGFTGSHVGSNDEATDRRFELAWRDFLSGSHAEARRRLDELRTKQPLYLPALLAQSALEIRDGNAAGARALIEQALAEQPGYTAAEVYAAEVSLREQQTRRAYEIYRAVAKREGVPPPVRERAAELEQRLFEELFASARTAPDKEAIRLLREALTITPGSQAARTLLVEKLIAERAFDEARRALDPLLTSDPDRAEVQQALAEIDAGRGRYEEAIARYERLARRDSRFRNRLEDLKRNWIASNMPPQFQAALEATTITRADFAVLLYWKVSSIRFAQNVGAPPIAVDIDVPGREELIRAIALGIFPVDPVTRRVYPSSPVTAGNAARLAARVLLARAACARQATADTSEASRAQKILASCRVSDPSAGQAPDAPIGGRATASLLEQMERAIGQ